MKEFDVLGCGRFSESVWMDLLTTDESGRPTEDESSRAPSVRDLQHHMEACRQCRAEWNAFARLASHVTEAVQPTPAVREAFIDSVLASARQGESPARQGESPARQGQSPVRQVHSPARQRGPAVASVPGPSLSSATDGGRRRRRRWAVPANVAVAAVLAFAAVLGAGLLSWPWRGPDLLIVSEAPSLSTGQALPGGLIVKAPAGAGSGTARAGALRSHVQVAAVSGGGDEPGSAQVRPAVEPGLGSGSGPGSVGDSDAGSGSGSAARLGLKPGLRPGLRPGSGPESDPEIDAGPSRAIRVTLGVTAGSTDARDAGEGSSEGSATFP